MAELCLLAHGLDYLINGVGLDALAAVLAVVILVVGVRR